MGQFVTNLYPQKVGNTFPFQRISLHITQKESALKHWKSGNSAPSFFTFCHTLMSSPGENFCHWGHQVSPKRKKKERNNAFFGAKFRLLEKKLRRVYEWPRRKRSYLCFLTKIKVLSKTFYKKTHLNTIFTSRLLVYRNLKTVFEMSLLLFRYYWSWKCKNYCLKLSYSKTLLFLEYLWLTRKKEFSGK